MTVHQFAVRDIGIPAPFVEVLTSQNTDTSIGQILGGGLSGPDAVAIGDAALMDALSDRLLALPTLPWMRGRLFLVNVEAMDMGADADLRRILHQTHFHDAILLPYRAGGHQACVDVGYWTVLRLAQSLGMIAGRGVPRRIDLAPLRVI